MYIYCVLSVLEFVECSVDSSRSQEASVDKDSIISGSGSDAKSL